MNPILSTLLYAVVTSSEPLRSHDLLQRLPETRRIHGGKEVGETRPYMVYMKPATQTDPQLAATNWLCGGVIIHPRYILTSAACIEDAKNFFVVSGTHTWTQHDQDNECVKYSAKKAVWKCVPKDYFFDGSDFDNIRWMSRDIAVVKVEDDFNFQKRVRGCDFIPKMIKYNNISQEFEKPGTMSSIAGWGTLENYGDILLARSTQNSPRLLETDAQIISKANCKKRWEPRYHNIIDESMICTKDDQDSSLMSTACIEHGVNCKEMEYADEDSEVGEDKTSRRMIVDPSGLDVHGSRHHQLNATRRYKVPSGGFCENDHGGPLIVGHGTTSMVIGVISACMTKDISKKCYGPYLYTSVWSYRHLISCAIDKDVGSVERCRKAFGDLRTTKNQIPEVTFDWKQLL